MERGAATLKIIKHVGDEGEIGAVMTKFKRCGFWRRSKFGERHWVPDTTVERNNWGNRTANSVPDLFRRTYPELADKKRRATACFVVPNAKCPECGESVFYYQNEFGSRVFFDELGPPWPKHPCTDTQLSSAHFDGTQLGLTFETRSQPAIVEIMTWQRDCDKEIESEFIATYGAKPWSLATVVQRMKAGKLVFVVAKRLTQDNATFIYFSCKTLAKCCKMRCLIAVRKQKISFIDTTTLDDIEVPIKRYRGATPFWEAMGSGNPVEGNE